MHEGEARRRLSSAFQAAVAAADPVATSRAAVMALPDLAPRVRLFALGKAAHAMASGARAALDARGVAIDGGLVVAHADDPGAAHGLPSIIGDHPLPGPRSAAAATRLGAALDVAGPDEDALVLISGGGTSLVAAPVEGVPVAALQETFAALLASGVDIITMNALRRRLLRWGAGRLASALASRRVHCLIASDVLDADPSTVASGPCSADPETATTLRAMIGARGLEPLLPAAVGAYLSDVAAGRLPETPKPSAPRFGTTSVHVVLDYHAALRGAADTLRSSGAFPVDVDPTPLQGEAADMGAAFASRIAAWRREVLSRDAASGDRAALVLAGETTVTLAARPSGTGGRCQEFALSCARTLHHLGVRGDAIQVLAAGTDGRDGPTDAAGAIVDANTWARLLASGSDPDDALAWHRSYEALDATGALLRTGPTGTNVNDLIVALAAPAPEGGR